MLATDADAIVSISWPFSFSRLKPFPRFFLSLSFDRPKNEELLVGPGATGLDVALDEDEA